MAFTTDYPFATATNYNFDDTKIQVLSNTASLLPSTTSGTAYAYWKLDEGIGVVVNDTGGDAIDPTRDGCLRLPFDTNSWVTTGKFTNGIEGDGSGYITFPPYGVFERTDAFSIEFWVKFTSTSNQIFVSRQLNSGNFQGYGVQAVSGKLRTLLRDSLNNRITMETPNTYNNNALHHIIATYDGSSIYTGINMYVDNTLLSLTALNTNTLTASFSSTADLQISGRDGSNNPLAAGTVINDVVIYERELTAVDVAFRWNNGDGSQEIPGTATSYPTDNPFIKPHINIQSTDIDSFTASITVSGSDEVTFTLDRSGTEIYHDGAGWTNSSGYTQSNTLSETASNISVLSMTATDTLNWKAYLHSDNGTTTPIIESVEIQYNFSGLEEGDIQLCTVFGESKDSQGLVVSNTITVDLLKPIDKYDNIIVNQLQKNVVPDSLTGLWSINLAISDEMSNGQYIITMNNTKFSFQVPNTTSVDIGALIGVI
jgi:hypothetical protein